MDSPNFSGTGSDASFEASDKQDDVDDVEDAENKESEGEVEEMYKADVEDVVQLIRGITMLYDLVEDDWTPEVLSNVRRFVENATNPALFIYILDVELQASDQFPILPTHDLMYFLKYHETNITTENFYEVVMFGNVNGNVEGCLLNMMQEVYLPKFLEHNMWPESAKGTFFEKIHSFLGHLTDVNYKLHGLSIPYIPHEGANMPIEEAAKNKGLIKRLEGVMTQWSRQLRVAVSDSDDRSAAVLLTTADEHLFWLYRWESLMLMRDEFMGSAGKRVIDILSIAQSSLQLQFTKLLGEMDVAIEEADSNIRYMELLLKPTLLLKNENRLSRLVDHVPHLLNIVRSVCLTSNYYNTPKKMEKLCNNLTNQIILQCAAAIPIDDVFDSGRTRTAIAALQENIECCRKFRKVYDEVSLAHTKLCPEKPWIVDSSSLFANMDSFIRRNEDMIEICEAMTMFGRKDEPPIPAPVFCGSTSLYFSTALEAIEKTFEDAVKKISESRKSILNVLDLEWQQLKARFRDVVKELDLEVLNVLSSVMERIATVEDALIGLQAFYHYSRRPLIQNAMEEHANTIWRLLSREVTSVRQILLSPQHPHNVQTPTSAGPAIAAHLLVRRLLHLKDVMISAFWLPETKERVECLSQLEYVQSRVATLVNHNFTTWKDTVLESYTSELDWPLLRRSSSRPGLLEPDFHLTLKNLVNESVYWELLMKKLPQSVGEFLPLWGKVELFYENILSMVLQYNSIIAALSDEERLLFKELILQVDRKMSIGLFKLKWKEDDITGFLDHWYEANCQLNEFVEDYKKAVCEIAGICEKICEEKLLEIPPNTLYKLEALEEHTESNRNEAFIQVVSLYQILLKHLAVVHESFESVLSATGQHWQNFILKLDSLLEESLLICVKESMQVMLKALQGHSPLLQISVNLNEGKVTFSPTLQRISSLGHHFLPEIVGAFKVIPRIYEKLRLQGKNPPQFYMVVDKNPLCLRLQSAINDEVAKNVNEITDYLKVWQPYRHIWEENKDTCLSSYENKNPSIIEWDSDLAHWDANADRVDQIDSAPHVHFSRLDVSPLKLCVVLHCSEWKESICRILLRKSVNAIDGIVENCQEQMDKLLMKPKDLSSLEIALKRHHTLLTEKPLVEAQFPIIKQQFDILRKYLYPVPPKDCEKMETLSKIWENYLKMLDDTHLMLETCKETFKASLVEQCETSRTRINEMILRFRENGPFRCKWSTSDAFHYISGLEKEITEIESLEKRLRSDLTLFDCVHPVSQPLEAMKNELSVLRAEWEIVEAWENMWRQYRTSAFRDLSTMELENIVQDISRSISLSTADAADFGWNVTDEAAGEVDALMRCLPLINELKNPALRRRHWQQIEYLVRKELDPEDPEFTLSVIMDSKLYEHGSRIFELSRAATSELAVEESIKKIKEDWSAKKLHMKPFKEITGMYILIDADEIFQSIENDQTSLSASRGTRSGEAFLEDIEFWGKALSTVEEYLELVLSVQRQWIYLENIFTGDEISRQLPNETAIFRNITSDWVTITSRMNETLDVVPLSQQKDIFLVLSGLESQLDMMQKALSAFLEIKKRAFPRFYFISNDALLEILGNSKKPELIQPHLKNLFDNIILLQWDRGGATAMISADNEVVGFENAVECVGAIEIWLENLERTMRSQLKYELKRTRMDLKKCEAKREKIIKDHLGQTSILASQIQWTSDVSRALVSSHYLNNRSPLKSLRHKQKKILHALSELVRGGLSSLLRLKVVALITIEIHQRDVVDSLYKSNCLAINDFAWTSQLRFYWDKQQDECLIKQTNFCYEYGYEYLGNSGRLAVTPLTDRCYITLTTALHMNLGGSPKGPAGTGKTETVKDLGKALGAYVIVYNCSEALDYKSIGQLLSGLAQTGAWGCFDEFNRISAEVLSVVSQQISCILTALAGRASVFTLQDSEINLKKTCGIFITMNPGYAGRTELPDNLKAMFRPISMVVPDSAIIAEVTLYGEGFHECSTIAKKIVIFFELLRDQLSKQNHYDFGLRAMVSLLKYAGKKRSFFPNLSDTEIALLAIREITLPMLTADDIPLFNGIVCDLFPGTEVPVIEQAILTNASLKEMEAAGLQPVSGIIEKIVQLHDTIRSRHSVMLVGSTCSGKSVTWRMLKQTLKSLATTGHNFLPVTEYVINPKTLTVGELFGKVNLATSEWMDGIVSAVMRKISFEDDSQRKWVVFDGPIDPIWIENMNSVMDDNKVLTLINSERISLPSEATLIFEVEDLNSASPATISRAGMVHTDYADLTWQPFVTSWLQKLHRSLSDQLNNHIKRLLPRVLDMKKQYCKEEPKPHELAQVRSLCRLLDSFCVSELTELYKEEPNCEKARILTKLWFIFCLTWSVCGNFDLSGRRKMDAFIRETEDVFPVRETIYDYFVDSKMCKMSPWESKLDGQWTFNPSTPFHEIVVPSLDTLRYGTLTLRVLQAGFPVLLTGPVGVGKSCIVRKALLSQSSLTAALSSSTQVNGLQRLLESRLEKRTKGVFGPAGNRKMTVFLDDMNMPTPDEFGSQPPLELIRLWQDYGFWYDRHSQTKKIIDVSLCGAMGPEGGGRHYVPKRLLSLFTVFSMTFPHDSQLNRIYLTLLQQHLGTFHEEVKTIAEPITKMTLELFHEISEALLPIPQKTHYLFNLRDISRVFQGLLRGHKDSQNTIKKFLCLWTHEVHRVFGDRLVDDMDRDLFASKLDKLLGSYMDTTLSTFCVKKRVILFGDLLSTSGRYEEMGNFEAIKERLKNFVEDYNDRPGVQPLTISLFHDAVEHVCRISRVISQPWGHALLIGVGGSGKTLLARLAIHMCKYMLFGVSVSKNYNTSDFLEDLKSLYRQAGVEGRNTAFLFADSPAVSEEFFEIINSILGTGEVAGLFRNEELDAFKVSLENYAKKSGQYLTSENVSAMLVQRIFTHLHLVLTMNPSSKNYRLHLMRYPALIGSCTIDWFHPWPEEALLEVATDTLVTYDFAETFPQSSTDRFKTNEKIRNSIAEVLAKVHSQVSAAASDMTITLARPCYVTPTNFIYLIAKYMELLSSKKSSIRAQVRNLLGGLGSIEEARDNISIMSFDLEKAQGRVAEIQADCEVSLKSMAVKKGEIDEQSKMVKIENEKLREEEALLRNEAQAAQDDLDEVLPALEEAIQALDSLSKKDISELKSYGRPPAVVMLVMDAVCTLKGVPPDWGESKRLLGEQDFLRSLKEFDKNHISESALRQLASYTSQKDFAPEVVESVSVAARSLCMWVLAIENYAKLWRIVGPKQALLDDAYEKLRTKQEQISQMTAKLENLKGVLNLLNEEYMEKTLEMNVLNNEAAQLRLKLERAAVLVDGLADEKLRWEATVKELEMEFSKLPGDCLVPSAFMSYSGPFPSSYRTSLLNAWCELIREESEIPQSHDFKLLDFLVDPAEVRNWGECGLPLDDFSVENGVLTICSTRTIVLIDPQLQANKWIKNMFNDLTILDENAPHLLEILENCVKSGKPVLIQNVLENVKPALVPLITKNTVKEVGETVIELGNKFIRYNENFRLFVSTKLPNPNFPSDIATKATCVNFMVKQEGLQDQLLGLVVRKERPELEDLKTKTLQTISGGKKTLLRLEAELLNLLAASEVSLLENEALFTTLQDSRQTSARIKESILTAEETEAQIEKTRREYVPSAVRAALLFIALNSMFSVDPMYHFSLEAYTHLFRQSMEKSARDNDVQVRIKNINDHHTYAVYRYACCALFARHKLLFSFYISMKILENENENVKSFHDLLVQRQSIIKRENQPTNPAPDWLSLSAWDSIVALESLTETPGIIHSFQNETDLWRQWYLSRCPEKTETLDRFGKLNHLDRLILIKACRPDRLISAVTDFVATQLGRKFVEQIAYDLNDVYEESGPKIPIVLTLSPGVDPSGELLQLAHTKGLGDQLSIVSLGQGQTETAADSIQHGIKHGTWVFLANCHLSLSWMPTLATIVESIQMDQNVHPNFRLWLSSNPHKKFPISLLQDSVKMTTEPPYGIRGNMLHLYRSVSQSQLENFTHRTILMKLLFALAFFHAILVERRKFQQLGWSTIYQFNKSDFKMSQDMLHSLLNGHDEVPWDAVKYLIAEVGYGGHVTDEWDRRLLMAYANQLFCPGVLDSNFRLSSLESYLMPSENTIESAIKQIELMPALDLPEVFHQHANAEINFYSLESQSLCDTLLAMKAGPASLSLLKTSDQIVQIVEEILHQLPSLLDLGAARRNLPVGPMEVVVLQEGNVYNRLLEYVKNSLQDVKRAISGHVLLSEELDEIMTCLAHGRVPPSWLFVYPSLKSLGGWVQDLIKRVEMFKTWITSGIAPPVLWLGGFIFPAALLTAALQKVARSAGLPIDEMTWGFSPVDDERKEFSPVSEGIYVGGLLLEGAGWDEAEQCLTEPKPLQLLCKMPVVWFRPRIFEKHRTKGLYTCPCYYYPNRSESFVVAIELEAGNESTDVWIKRGTALLLSSAE